VLVVLAAVSVRYIDLPWRRVVAGRGVGAAVVGPTIVRPWRHVDGCERASHYRANTKAGQSSAPFDRVIDAIQATDAETKNDLADLDSDEEMTRRAFELLSSKPHNNYERALAALREDTRQWWAATLARDPLELMEDNEPATADAEGLHRFLERKVFPWFVERRKALLNRALICEQAFGEALDTDKLEQLVRYEVHLDRKLERMLAMLLRLKDLRHGTIG